MLLTYHYFIIISVTFNIFQPFDLGLAIRTVDTSSADMSIDVSISPELRGELDASKLGRLLQLIPVVTSTLNKDECLSAVVAADIAVFGTHLPLKPSAIIQLHQKPLLFPDLVSSLMKKQAKTKEGGEENDFWNGEDGDADVDHLDDVEKDTDVLKVRMRISMRIPEVALDLTYDVQRSRHLVLAMHALEMQMVFRQMDMQVIEHYYMSIYKILLMH